MTLTRHGEVTGTEVSRMSTLPSCSLPSSPQAISHGFTSVHAHAMSTLPSRSPTELFPSYFPRFHIRPRTCNVHASVSLPNGALPKLFPTVSHPSTHMQCPRFRLAPQRSSSQAISHGFTSVHAHAMSTLPSRSPTELFPSYFPRFHIRPRTCNVHASVSLPNGALPKLFPTVSHPSTHMQCPRFRLAPVDAHAMSTLPSRSPTELFPSYFPRFHIRPRTCNVHASVSPPLTHMQCPRFRLAPQRSSSQAISHGFTSVHAHAMSTLPSRPR